MPGASDDNFFHLVDCKIWKEKEKKNKNDPVDVSNENGTADKETIL